MTVPDFEIATSLRARQLHCRTPPDVQTTGDGAELDVEQRRARLPDELREGGRYRDAFVDTRIVGRMPAGRHDD